MANTSIQDVGMAMAAFGQNKAFSVSAAGQGQNGLFKDVLNKETDQAVAPKQSTSAKPAEPKNVRKEETYRTKTVERKISEKTEETEEELTPENQEKVASLLMEKAMDLLQQISDTFDVPVEELQGIMDEKQMSMLDLFSTDKLGELLLEASGENDSFSLVTNEELYAGYRDIMQMKQDAVTEIASDAGISKETVMQLAEPKIEVEDMRTDSKEENVSLLDENVPNVAEKNTAVENEGKQSSEFGERQGASERHKSAEKTSHEEPVAFQNTISDTQNVSFEQAGVEGSHFDTDTQNIMRQIMDFMKIQLRPESNQLTMQLHPASLGSLQVQLASKGGVVTAQFVAQNDAVKAALESQMIQLKETFEQQGIKVEAIEVTVQTHEFERNLDQGNERNEQPQEKKGRTRRIQLDDSLAGEDLTGMDREEVLTREMMAANGTTVDYTA